MSADMPPPLLGILEHDAEKLAQQLHGLAATGTKVSDAALLMPVLMSMAISAKRLADTLDACTTKPNMHGARSLSINGTLTSYNMEA